MWYPGVALRSLALALIAMITISAAPRGVAEASHVADQCVRAVQASLPQSDRIDVVRPDGQTPVVILRPPEYGATSRRYPVLYLLHGFNSDEESWLSSTDLLEFTASLPDERSTIVVMPYVPGAGTMIDGRDGRYRPERFTVETLIPYIDASYRTIADGAYRAFAGFSGGGGGALSFGAKHPALVAAVGGFSATADLEMVETSLANALQIAAISAWDTICKGHEFVASPLCDPIDRLCFARHNPSKLARNLGGLSVYTAVGDGLPCDEEDLVDPGYHAGSAAEASQRPANDTFDAALNAADVPHTYEPGCGSHSWRYWERYLHRFWDVMLDAFGRLEPEAFDFRSADRVFSAWDWIFTTDPARAAEFLDVTDASCAGLELTGSGTTIVTTAPCFRHGQTIALTGAFESVSRADETGRITFEVDLGPAHQHEQYTPLARFAEASEGYWTTQVVTFRETPSACSRAGDTPGACTTDA